MMESNPMNGALNSHKVTDFLTHEIKSFDELSGENIKESEEKYLCSLTRALEESTLVATGAKGSYLDIYSPVSAEGKNIPVAVKVFNKESANFKTGVQHFEEGHNEEEMKSLISNKSFIQFSYKEGEINYDELTTEEKNFLLLALEQSRYETFFEPYVLPTVFAAFKSKNDIVDPDVMEFDGPYGFDAKKMMDEKGRLTSDSKYIPIKSGEVVFSAIQNFEPTLKSIFEKPLGEYPAEQQLQIKDFLLKVQEVAKDKGFFPDQYTFSKTTNNLCFDDKNRLILVDTNLLYQGKPWSSYEKDIDSLLVQLTV